MVGISLPITLGLIFTAPILINLFAGSTYHDAIFTLQLLSPIVLAISMSGVSGIQVLYPMGKVNIVILATGIGAAFNFLPQSLVDSCLCSRWCCFLYYYS